MKEYTGICSKDELSVAVANEEAKTPLKGKCRGAHGDGIMADILGQAIRRHGNRQKGKGLLCVGIGVHKRERKESGATV